MSFADDFYEGAQPVAPTKKSNRKKQAADPYLDFEAQNPSNEIEYQSSGSAQAKSVANDITEVLGLIDNQENKIEKIIKKLGTKAETKELRHELCVIIF